MSASTAGSNKCPLISLPLGVVLLVLFFLPWLNLTCVGKGLFSNEDVIDRKVGHASGWQLAVGTMTVFDEDEERNPKKVTDPDKLKEVDETILARPLFYLGLLAPVVLLALGVLAMIGSISGALAGRGMIVVGIVGVLVFILAMMVDYTDDFIENKRTEAREKMTKAGASEAEIDKALEEQDAVARKQLDELEENDQGLQTSGKLALWVTFVLYLATLGLGVAVSVCGCAACAAKAPAPPEAASEPKTPAATQAPPEPQQQDGPAQ